MKESSGQRVKHLVEEDHRRFMDRIDVNAIVCDFDLAVAVAIVSMAAHGLGISTKVSIPMIALKFAEAGIEPPEEEAVATAFAEIQVELSR